MSHAGQCLGTLSGDPRFMTCETNYLPLHFHREDPATLEAKELGSDYYRLVHGENCLNYDKELEGIRTAACSRDELHPQQTIVFTPSGAHWKLGFLGVPGCLGLVGDQLQILPSCVGAQQLRLVKRPEGIHLAFAHQQVCLDVQEGALVKGACALFQPTPLGWQDRLQEVSEKQRTAIQVTTLWNREVPIYGTVLPRKREVRL